MPIVILNRFSKMLATSKRMYWLPFVLLLFTSVTYANDVAKSPFQVPATVNTVIKETCLRCHGEKRPRGGIRLDNLGTLTQETRLDLLNKAQDQLFSKLMPPENANQPSAAERSLLQDWVRNELKKYNASRLDEKLRDPAYGNLVDHDQLFSGRIKDKAFTPARRWLVSPQIFHERVNAVFKLSGRTRQNNFYGVTNPIVLPDHAGVRYYDTAVVDGGHLLIMLNNAKWISEKQIMAAVYHDTNKNKIPFPNARDRWLPPGTEPEFVAIVSKNSTPTDDEMTAAIHAQFQCVLQRNASEAELRRYVPLLKSTIKIGGNREGLRAMLVSVLLESEFLYRLEFGAGEPDEFGRKMLSPREATYAIAYALSDRIPDDKLVQAANDGRLSTRDDFRREVLRLLNDHTIFLDEGASAINGLHLRSHKVTHPKINRFFREFFGYANSMKVFKDEARSDGFYSNPDRGYTGTAGALTNEADRVVDYIIRQDRDVFEQLLTTDEFFVLHRHSNEEGQKIVAGWKKIYDVLKDADWQKNPDEVLKEHFDKQKNLFKLLKGVELNAKRPDITRRNFKNFMDYFDNTFGKGLTPYTNPWFYHGGQKFRYSPAYNLPRPAGAGPLGSRSRGKYLPTDTWDYPVVQPFKIPNRKGILTHPAWLIAHAKNAETDPVRRGRWIREKLLAGYVPDVPITVDAQIPEDPHRTLGERLISVTSAAECWKCHKQMNPLGLPFEVFDDFGRYRKEESLEHPENLLKKGDGKSVADIFKTKPVVANGVLNGTGNPKLDGDVDGPFQLIDRLAKSERVRQSIIRHAFRYFMGRNERLSDSQTLIDADRAYVDNGGSFKALVVSLLTSDSFIYRKAIE